MLERLQKIIARAGLASRRHAEQLILSGQVSLNGKVITELGTKADAARDHIRVGSNLLRPAENEAKRYFMLHKPPRVVATMDDPERRPSLHGYVQHIPGRIFPIGRLEFSGSGLLILTSDGDLASRLLRASRRLRQTYWLKLNGRLMPEAQRRVEDFAQARMRIVRNAANPWYEVHLAAVSRDRLRRALAEENLLVEKFMRTGFAGLELGDLQAGVCRPLTPEEIKRLERAAAAPGKLPVGQRAAAAMQAHKPPRPLATVARKSFHSARPAPPPKPGRPAQPGRPAGTFRPAQPSRFSRHSGTSPGPPPDRHPGRRGRKFFRPAGPSKFRPKGPSPE
jgi:23S rRNA pseudouridine2605 synthase